jgi:hypothetical protein
MRNQSDFPQLQGFNLADTDRQRPINLPAAIF